MLLVLIFSKYFYMAGLSSFYTFCLIEKFGLSVHSAQVHLFIFLFASAVGTLLGGPISDRIGRKPVIWVSILGVAPFALLLPHVDLFWTTTLTIDIGLKRTVTHRARHATPIPLAPEMPRSTNSSTTFHPRRSATCCSSRN